MAAKPLVAENTRTMVSAPRAPRSPCPGSRPRDPPPSRRGGRRSRRLRAPSGGRSSPRTPLPRARNPCSQTVDLVVWAQRLRRPMCRGRRRHCSHSFRRREGSNECPRPPAASLILTVTAGSLPGAEGPERSGRVASSPGATAADRGDDAPPAPAGDAPPDPLRPQVRIEEGDDAATGVGRRGLVVAGRPANFPITTKMRGVRSAAPSWSFMNACPAGGHKDFEQKGGAIAEVRSGPVTRARPGRGAV